MWFSHFYNLYRKMLFQMCGITYFNTICVHLLKSAYSLLKMRIVEKRKTSQQVGGL